VGVPVFAPGDDALLRDNRCDFIGLNYYRRETVSAQPPEVPTGGEPGVDGLFYFVRNPQSTYTEWGWEIWPQGLTDGIMMIKARYGDIPIYITENGLGAKTRLLMAKSSTIRGSTISAAILPRWKKRWSRGRRARLLSLVLY
jgi:6-phospho-beta-glucosidase